MNNHIARATEEQEDEMRHIGKSMSTILQQAKNNHEIRRQAGRRRVHLDNEVVNLGGLLNRFNT